MNKALCVFTFFITVRGTGIPDITQIAAMDLKTVRSSPHM